MNKLKQRKLLSVLSHGSLLFSFTVIWLVIPIVILVISHDPIVRQNAKEAINFGINIIVYFVIFGLLAFVFIGIPMLFILLLVNWIMPIIAMVHAATNLRKPYRYPFTWRLI